MSPSHYGRWRPHGLGTGDVESLTSAVRRLAHCEVRPVGYLLREYVIDPYQRERDQRQPILQPTRVTEAINGASDSARVIVDRLAVAGISELDRTTLLDRDDGIEFREAFRSWRAWCPACLEIDGDEAYDRLAWAFIATRSCGRHATLLVDRCVRCGRGHRSWHTHANPWSCPHCGALLAAGDQVERPTDPPTAHVREVLALIESGCRIERASVAGAFCALRDRAGGLRRLSAALGHSVAGLSTICGGVTRPHLRLFLGALVMADEPIEVFVSHRPSTPRAMAHRAIDRRVPPRLPTALVRDLRLILRSAGPVPSLRHFAHTHHVDPATLRRHLPDLARELVRRRRAIERRRRRAAEASLARTVRAVFVRLAQTGHVPSRRQLEVAIGRAGVFRAPAARRAYAEMLRNSGI